jgi:hypothetical protein
MQRRVCEMMRIRKAVKRRERRRDAHHSAELSSKSDPISSLGAVGVGVVDNDTLPTREDRPSSLQTSWASLERVLVNSHAISRGLKSSSDGRLPTSCRTNQENDLQSCTRRRNIEDSRVDGLGRVLESQSERGARGGEGRRKLTCLKKSLNEKPRSTPDRSQSIGAREP